MDWKLEKNKETGSKWEENGKKRIKVALLV